MGDDLYRRPRSPYWWYSFTINGDRLRGSTGTADRETAKIIVAKKKSDLLIGAATGKRPSMTLDAAFGRYWEEVAQHQPSADNTDYQLENLENGLGKDRLLDGSWGDLSEYIAKRRAQVSDSSVNREIELLRRVMRRADTVWEVAVRMPNWKALHLQEPDDVSHPLKPEEEDRLFEHLRPDFHPLFRFALASGVRLMNCCTLQWEQIAWAEMVIKFAVKSRKKGGKVHIVPITDEIAAILGAERGKHPTHVFTYVCARAVRNRKVGRAMVRGQRYPFTKNGWRKPFMEARAAAGLPTFRFHDLRHTTGTRVTLDIGIKAAKDLLGHESISTTLRYAKGDVANLRDAMNSMSQQRRAKLVSQSHSGHTDPEKPAQPIGETRKKSV
jgi:integrase